MLRVCGRLILAGLGCQLLAVLFPGVGLAYAQDSAALYRRIETSTITMNDAVASIEIVSAPAALTESAVDSELVKARRWVFRQLLSPRPVEMAVFSDVTAKEGPRPGSIRDGSSVVIRLAEADPNFNMWQQHAKERLKEEESPTGGEPETPLALAHPNDFVIVCAAGCREKDTPDHIVYMVSKAVAATGLSSTRKLETTAAEAAQGSDAKPKSGDVVGDQDVILCVAGCYDTPKVYRSGEPVRADAKPFKSDLVKAASATSTDIPVAAQQLSPIKKRLQKIVSLNASIKRKRSSSLGSNNGWRTKVVRDALAVRSSGLTRLKHLDHIQHLKEKADHRRKLAKVSSGLTH